MNFPRLIGSWEWTKGAVRSCLGNKQVSPIEDLILVKIKDGKVPKSKIQQMGYQTMLSMLQALDVEIWQDSHVFTTSKFKSTSFLFGFSAGAAAFNTGWYRMIGLQFDYGYDFEKKEAYFKRSWVNQKLSSALLCFESMMVFGILPQYELDIDRSSEEARTVALPFGVAYRSSPKSVGVGWLSGVSLADIVGVGIMYMGHVEEGAAFISVMKAPTLFSLYASHTQISRMAPSKIWASFSNRLNQLLGRKKPCEDLLNPDDKDKKL